MSRVSVRAYTVSLDGYGAGPEQSRKHPLGVGGEDLHHWLVTTRTFGAMYGTGEGTTGTDDDYARSSMEGLGAWIMGRNMFAPSRGPWPDDGWRGWWGPNPPYHVPVFVLTHHARAPLEMEGGTTFHFVTEGNHEALRRAREAAGAKGIRIGGGAATVRQYLEARLVDEMHLAVSPMLLGSGESLFAGLDLVRLGYRVRSRESTESAMHVIVERGDAV